jgi:hypothetical protein
MWTNITIRKYLGERGFIERQTPKLVDSKTGFSCSYWDRLGQTLKLWEHKTQTPELWDSKNKIIDPLDIKPINPNIAGG